MPREHCRKYSRSWVHLYDFVSSPSALDVSVPLERAQEALKTERQKVLTERDAFRKFEQRVSNLSPTRPAKCPVEGANQILNSPTTKVGLQRVRQAYDEMVMSVGHYENEYGEDLVTHVEAELGTECAEALYAETELTPHLQRAFLMAAADIHQRRALFAKVLDEEGELLDRIETFPKEVRPLPSVSGNLPFAKLCKLYETLRRYERQAESLLTERQEHLHRSWAGISRSNRINPKSLNHYLYGSLQTSFPVLDLLTQLLLDIWSLREKVARYIANYHG